MVKNILILSGGAVKAIAMLGYLQKLYETNQLVDIDTYAGTSSGSIICLLLLIGYTPKELFEVLTELDFSLLFQYDLDNLFENSHIGLMCQEPIIYVIGTLMKKKNFSIKITFDELYKKYNKKLIVTGTCLNDISLHYFDYKKFPNMKILDAIKISISIPIIFKAITYKNLIYVDGGCMSNLPIEYFDDSEINNIIAISLKYPYEFIDKFITHQDYLTQLLKCLCINCCKYPLKYKDIIVNIEIFSITSWNLTNDEKNKLYDEGYKIVV